MYANFQGSSTSGSTLEFWYVSVSVSKWGQCVYYTLNTSSLTWHCPGIKKILSVEKLFRNCPGLIFYLLKSYSWDLKTITQIIWKFDFKNTNDSYLITITLILVGLNFFLWQKHKIMFIFPGMSQYYLSYLWLII